MAQTVRQMLKTLADGDGLLLSTVIADFETRDWPQADLGRHSTPDDNSPTWIDQTEGLGPQTRFLLRQAYERAVFQALLSSDKLSWAQRVWLWWRRR